jgi:hypothetical protein
MLSFIGELLIQVLLEIICGATGHCVLALVTFGRWKAIQDDNTLAMLVGVLVWFVAGVGLVLLLR